MAKLQHLLDVMDKRLLLQSVHDYVLIIKKWNLPSAISEGTQSEQGCLNWRESVETQATELKYCP